LHIATKLTNFIPIIHQLQELHAKGYVHGDIRGLNVVFEENGGGLIDFDFSGMPEKDTYPPGYRQSLNDGDRIGDGNAKSEDNKLAFWHDWYALGQLIFNVNKVKPPSNSTMDADELLLSRTEKNWMEISEPPSEAKIIELISTLRRLEQARFTVVPKSKFRKDFNAAGVPNVTKLGATGSPLQV
jgi:serine/threonine protein kinase